MNTINKILYNILEFMESLLKYRLFLKRFLFRFSIITFVVTLLYSWFIINQAHVDIGTLDWNNFSFYALLLYSNSYENKYLFLLFVSSLVLLSFSKTKTLSFSLLGFFFF